MRTQPEPWRCPQCERWQAPHVREHVCPRSAPVLIAPDGLTPRQLRELQEALGSLCAEQRWAGKVTVLPHVPKKVEPDA